MRTRILGARVIDPSSGLDQVADLYIEGGKLSAIGQAPAAFAAEQTLDASGLVAAPGATDARNDERAAPRGRRVPGVAVQAGRTDSACGPFAPVPTSNVTAWPSSRTL